MPEIKRWLETFLLQFSYPTSQFKRSALPNGPKISSGGSLSPRGDRRAPSDGNAKVWIESCWLMCLNPSMSGLAYGFATTLHAHAAIFLNSRQILKSCGIGFSTRRCHYGGVAAPRFYAWPDITSGSSSVAIR